MNNHKNSTSELDHIRETLTELVSTVGLFRSDNKKRLDKIEQRIGKTEQRIGNIEQRVGNIEHCIGNIEQRIGNIEQRIDKTEQRIEEGNKENSKRFDKIEETLSIIVNYLQK